MLINKPTPDEVAQLREAFPKGAPRFAYRETLLTIDRAAVANSPLIPLSISSEAPVLRYDWWEGEEYWEVLDHSPNSVDLSYARDGLPFIASHRSMDADSMHGIIEDVTVDKDRVLRGVLRPSAAVRSQEIAQDMRDGIRKKISAGYVVSDEYDQTQKAADGIPIRRYMAWMPIEGSTVPVPADYSVGVGRATSPAGREAIARFLTVRSLAKPSTWRASLDDYQRRLDALKK